MLRFGLIRLAKNQVQKSLFRFVETHLSQTLKLKNFTFEKNSYFWKFHGAKNFFKEIGEMVLTRIITIMITAEIKSWTHWITVKKIL